MSKFLVQLLFIAWQLVFMTQLELTRERFLFIEQLPLLYVDLPLRFRPLGHSAWVREFIVFQTVVILELYEALFHAVVILSH